MSEQAPGDRVALQNEDADCAADEGCNRENRDIEWMDEIEAAVQYLCEMAQDERFMQQVERPGEAAEPNQGPRTAVDSPCGANRYQCEWQGGLDEQIACLQDHPLRRLNPQGYSGQGDEDRRDRKPSVTSPLKLMKMGRQDRAAVIENHVP